MSPLRHLLAAVLLLAACGPAAGADLDLALVGGERDAEGRLVLQVPFEGDPGLRFELRNRGGETVQVVRSSYPCYRFFRLIVRREGDPEGTELPVYFDLYPLKDMKAPARECVTLAPGAALSRSAAVLLAEGYGLETFSRGDLAGHFRELREQGFGALRRSGVYEVRAVWSPVPREDGGVFEEGGRDAAVPLYAGPEIRSAPLEVVVRHRWGWTPEVRTEVAATHVARGVIRGDAAAIDSAAARGGDYVDLGVEVDRGEVPFRFFAASDGRDPDALAMRALLGRTRLLLLGEYEGKLYLADTDGGTAVREPDEGLGRRLLYCRELAGEPAPEDPEIARQVEEILAGLTESPAAEEEGFRRLEELGPAAVPAMVNRMDDRRPLPARHITLRNLSGGAFEAVRHYSPEQVVDALAAILNQLTGEHFGLSVNDPDDGAREHAVQGWRVFAHLRTAAD